MLSQRRAAAPNPIGDVLIGTLYGCKGARCPVDTSAKQKRRPSRAECPRINNKVSPAFSKAAVSKGRAFGRAPQSAKPPCFKKRRGFRDPRRGSLPHHHSRLLRQQKPTIIFCCPIRRCVNWFTFTSVRFIERVMGLSIHSRQIRLNPTF